MTSYSCTVWVDIGYFQGLMLSHEVKKTTFYWAGNRSRNGAKVCGVALAAGRAGYILICYLLKG